MGGSNTVLSRSEATRQNIAWTSLQAYLLAAFTLLLGVALGYLFRGSASSGSQVSAGKQEVQNQQQAEPAVLAESVAPLLEAVTKNPADYESLVSLGNAYYDAKQYSNAIQYYQRALAIHPENPDVRTDMGTAYWYSGNADQALEQVQRSLKYRPGHPQSLFNLGWIRWQAKADAKGAVEAWEMLLKTNPNYPQKQQVEQYIAKAKEHASRG